MIGESYRQRQSTPDELRERYANNAILGMEDAVDPETGDRFRVGSGSNCYWIDDRGRIVETEVETRPGWILGRWCELDRVNKAKTRGHPVKFFGRTLAACPAGSLIAYQS
ncbi:MAG: hypothetical protein K6U03_00290 [Firmicutes bacterium]|nr:hypothetical protein [Bacillota bacterium]